LLGDIGIWFLAGVLIAGAISTFVPADFIAANLGQGFLPMLIMLVIAVPMYVCATATTPIAAALAIKGLSPGAALVFLLAGPATNMASLTVVSKILGKKATGIYLATILICSLAMGLAANWIYTRTGMSITAWIQKSGREHRSLLSEILAVALLALILKPLLQKYLFRKKTCDCDHGPDHSHEDSAH
jgi:hypothetical protein